MRWRRAPHGLLPPRFSTLARELSAVEQVAAVLHTAPPSAVEPALDLLAPLLTPHTVSAVLQDHSVPLPSAFRFFAWASRRRHLRSWLSYNLIVSALRRHPDALPSASAHLPRPVPPPALTALVSACAAAGMPDEAVAAFARMPELGCRPNTFAYNTLLRILIDGGLSLLAMALYSRMLKSDCRPNRATYNILIHGLSKAGSTDDALRLFDEMLRRAITPDTAVYTLFLSLLCRAGRIGDAKRLLGSMKHTGYKPDWITYNTLLSGLCRLGEVDEALLSLRSFQRDGFVLGLDGYSCLIDGLFHAGRFKEACGYYNEMLAKNIAPDVVLYTIMIRGYLAAGRIDEALAVLGEMTGHGLEPDTFCYNTLIKGLCDAGLLDQARSLRLEISQHDRFPDAATYTIMICGLCKEGLIHEAQQIFDEMGKLGCIPTVMTFNALINGLCKAGKLEEARILFYKMEMGRNPSLFLRLSQGAEKIRDSTSLRKLVDELCQKGLVLKAYKLLRDIIDSGVVPDVVTYNILIHGLCKVGNPDGALKLFKELQLKGHSPDEVTYGTLIDGLLQVHREDESQMVFQHMLRSGFTPSLSIYGTLMRTLCRKRRVSQAVILWLNHISRESRRPETSEIIDVVHRNFEQGDIEAAVRGLLEMDRQFGSLDSFPYTIWLIGYCQARKVDEALRIFSILSEFGVDVTPPSCVLLINCLCWKGKLASALDVMFYTLRKGFLLMQPVGNRLLRRLCVNNKRKDACELAQRMHVSGYDMDAYLRSKTKDLLYGQQF